MEGTNGSTRNNLMKYPLDTKDNIDNIDAGDTSVKNVQFFVFNFHGINDKNTLVFAYTFGNVCHKEVIRRP